MNVVLIVVDSLRRDHVGAYGSDRVETPSLDRLAGESLRFNRAYPESLPTICARRAIHTGLRTFPFRDWDQPGKDDVNLWGWQPIPADQTTLAEILREQGYSTMFVTDTLHQFRPFYNFHRGFDTFDFIRGQERDYYRPASLATEKEVDKILIRGSHQSRLREIMTRYIANIKGRRGEEDYFAPRVFTQAMEFLEGAKEQQPFFLTVDAYDPHEPWDPPDEYVSRYDTGYGRYSGQEPKIPPYENPDWLSEKSLRRMQDLYAGEITMVDTWLGKFLDRLRDLELMDSTLLVFLSDHGHAFGEHGYVGKSPPEMYPEIMDVPFIIRHPRGEAAGQTSDFRASTHDVTPTILGALGIDPPAKLEGADLTPFLTGGDRPSREYATAAYHDHVWARDDHYALIARNDGSEARLYDIQNDPGQEENVAGEDQDTAKRMFRDYILADAGGVPLPRY